MILKTLEDGNFEMKVFHEKYDWSDQLQELAADIRAFPKCRETAELEDSHADSPNRE